MNSFDIQGPLEKVYYRYICVFWYNALGYIFISSQEVFENSIRRQIIWCILVQLRNDQIDSWSLTWPLKCDIRGEVARLRGVIISSFATVWEAIILSLSRIVLWQLESYTLNLFKPWKSSNPSKSLTCSLRESPKEVPQNGYGVYFCHRIILAHQIGNHPSPSNSRFHENYNTPLEHNPGNPPSQLWKESLYGLLVKV